METHTEFALFRHGFEGCKVYYPRYQSVRLGYSFTRPLNKFHLPPPVVGREFGDGAGLIDQVVTVEPDTCDKSTGQYVLCVIVQNRFAAAVPQ